MRSPVELLNAHFDSQVLSEEEAKSLSDWVNSDPANARAVVELGVIHSQADYLLSVSRFIDELEDSTDPAVRQSLSSAIETIELESYRGQNEQRLTQPAADTAASHRGWYAMAAVAAAALLAVTTLLVGRSSTGLKVVQVAQAPLNQPLVAPPVVPVQVLATVTDALEAVSITGERFRRGRQVLPKEVIELEKGVLALTTAVGSEVVLEAPATLVFEDAQHLVLRSGRLAARIDEEATGLVVTTPTGRVVDLGTEFGVGVGPTLETEVAVYDGVVELYGVANGMGETDPPKRITAGRSGRVDEEGKIVWAVQTLENDRGFIRPDEIASLRKAIAGSAEARQQVGFYSLQRVAGLVGFQSFDIPSAGAGYAVSFNGLMPRSVTDLRFIEDLSKEHLYTSGALEVAAGEAVFLDLDTSSDSPLARAGLLTDQGHVGRSGAELWISWKSQAVAPERTGDSAGLSLMFGDHRHFQEPIFIGQSTGKQSLTLLSKEGSRAVELELDSDDTTFHVEAAPLGGQVHQWVAQLIFGQRSDKIAVWCDVPFEAIRETRPQVETVNANIMFDRLRLGVSPDGDAWRFDDIVMATTVYGLAEAAEAQAASATGPRF